MEDFLRAGLAEVNITPPVGISMAGYWSERRAQGVHDDIYAKALVLDDGENQIALIGCDLIGLDKESVSVIRKMAAEGSQIPGDHVLVCATHTHTGPQTLRLLTLLNPVDEVYLDVLRRKIAGAVYMAKNGLKKAKIGVGSGYEDRIAFNRRYRYDPSNTVIDPEVGVVRVDDLQGVVMGVVVNYACHLAVVGGSLFSADYPGYLADTIRKVKGSGTITLFMNGPCGNIAHIDFTKPERPKGYEHAERMGVTLACDALKTMEWMRLSSRCDLRAKREVIELPLKYPSKGEVEEAERKLREIKEDIRKSREKVYAKELLLLDQLKAQWGSHLETEVQALALGDTVFVTAPGELFVEFGLEVKKRSSFKHTFIVELANDYVGYIATREAFKQGGYEVADRSRHIKLDLEAGEIWQETALKLIENLQ